MPTGVYVRRPFTAEHRANMSTALKGNMNAVGCTRSPETRAKLSAAKKGGENPAKRPDVRRKMSESAKGNHSHLGHRHTPEMRARISAGCKGKTDAERHPNWQGGISRSPYGWDYSPELKAEVRRRDEHKCQLCGTPQSECSKKLAVHHIDYDKRNSDPVNLVSLCLRCHGRVHKNKKHWKGFLQAQAINAGRR